MTNIIFYFSGTGNSLVLAKRIADKLNDTKVVPIKRIADYSLNEYERIGFIFPVYYIHAPKFVMEKLKKLKFSRQQQIFLLAAFAGSWGYAVRDAYSAIANCNKELIHNKQVLIQEFRVRMPGNYILEYGAVPRSYQNYLLKKAEVKLEHIIAAIVSRKPTNIIKPNLIAKIYKHKGLEKPKEFQQLGMQFDVNEKCTSCRRCAAVCPSDNIIFDNGRINWGKQCQQCMACIQWCPNNAIVHPLLKKDRIKYTNPLVSVSEMQVSGTSRSF